MIQWMWEDREEPAFSTAAWNAPWHGSAGGTSSARPLFRRWGVSRFSVHPIAWIRRVSSPCKASHGPEHPVKNNSALPQSEPRSALITAPEFSPGSLPLQQGVCGGLGGILPACSPMVQRKEDFGPKRMLSETQVDCVSGVSGSETVGSLPHLSQAVSSCASEGADAVGQADE